MLSLGTAGMTVVGLVAVLITTFYLYMKVIFGYWKRRNVPVPDETRFPCGNFTATVLSKENLGQSIQTLYMKHRKERYIGTHFFHVPLLQVHDLEIVKQLFVKEFPNFNGRGIYCNPEHDPISGHLVILSGPRWKNLRIKLTPVFTTGKLKYMFGKIRECAEELEGMISADAAANGGTALVDIRETMARFSTDVISSVAFGIEPNAMKDPNSEFRRFGKKTVEPSFQNKIRGLGMFFLRGAMKFFKIRIVPKEVGDFMHRIVHETIKYREENNIDRPDMMNLLIQLKNKGFVASDEMLEGYENVQNGETQEVDKTLKTLSVDEIIAQCFVFLVAGFETTSATTSFTLYEVAKNPEVQKKLLQEVDEVMKRHNNIVSYDAIMEMPYLDNVISETLRYYPPITFLTREAMKTCKLPLTDVVLEEGTRITIPVLAFHHDPEFFPEPEKYDPERFAEGNKTWPTFAYLPFGDGPRVCIGMRFAHVQMKASILTLLSKFRVELGDGVPNKLTMDPQGVLPSPIETVNLKLIARNK